MLALLGFYCCMWAFSSYNERVVHHGRFSCGTRALGTQASVVANHGLSSCAWQALEHRLNSSDMQA